MNIFVLNAEPTKSAKMLCDQHVVKMPIETAQMLCAPFPKNKAPYKRTHFNHPCTVWARTSKQNYVWLIKYGIALCDEYEFRFKREHKSKKVICWCKQNVSKLKFPQNKLTNFVQAVPEKYKSKSAITAYKKYYIRDKSAFARWNNQRKPPKWYLNGLKNLLA